MVTRDRLSLCDMPPWGDFEASAFSDAAAGRRSSGLPSTGIALWSERMQPGATASFFGRECPGDNGRAAPAFRVSGWAAGRLRTATLVDHTTRVAVVVLALSWIALVGLLDYWTGPEHTM